MYGLCFPGERSRQQSSSAPDFIGTQEHQIIVVKQPQRVVQNTNNIISDDLSAAGRGNIKTAAGRALKAKNWNEIVVWGVDRSAVRFSDLRAMSESW